MQSNPHLDTTTCTLITLAVMKHPKHFHKTRFKHATPNSEFRHKILPTNHNNSTLLTKCNSPDKMEVFKIEVEDNAICKHICKVGEQATGRDETKGMLMQLLELHVGTTCTFTTTCTCAHHTKQPMETLTTRKYCNSRNVLT